MTSEVEILPVSLSERVIVFERLYETCFPSVARLVSKMKGSLEDASDIFQDALIIYLEKMQDDKFTLQTNEEAYILGIAKHLSMRKFINRRNFVSLDETIEIPNDYFPSVNTVRMLTFLETTGKKCLDLLRSFYFENKALAEIARSSNYSGEHSASVQKYKCIEKLRESIKQKPELYENLFE